MLDFGCGCGRIARNWVRLRGPELHGCDYNPEPVAWCRENLPFLEARVNSLEPPSPYSDDRFDLVYAISVLTHLPEALAHRWMADFARILRTGGQLLVTTHGDALREALGTRDRARYDAGEIVVRRPHMAGEDSCVAHHPRSYVTDRLLGGFDPVSFSGGDETPGFAHDVYLARLRAR